MITVYCKLVALEKDIGDYTTYVFENLELNPPFGYKYIMVVRFPRWEHRNLELNEIGYLTYNSVVGGQDAWFDRNTQQFVPYNYTNNIFIKFVKKVDNLNKDIII